MSILRAPYEMYTQVFGTVYVALMTNLLLVVACLPFVTGLVATEDRKSTRLNSSH